MLPETTAVTEALALSDEQIDSSIAYCRAMLGGRLRRSERIELERDLAVFEAAKTAKAEANPVTIRRTKRGFHVTHNLDPLTGQPWEAV